MMLAVAALAPQVGEAARAGAAPRPDCTTVLVLKPGTQHLLPGTSVTLTARELSCNVGVPDVPLAFSVSAGPDAGTAAPAVTNSAGRAAFSFVGGGLGIDYVEVTAGASVAPAEAIVIWETAQLKLQPASGLPGTTVSFSGSGYTPGETVELWANTPPGPGGARDRGRPRGRSNLSGAIASPNGTIAGSFAVPPPGDLINAVVAVGDTSGVEGWATFYSTCTDEWINPDGGAWITGTDWSTGLVPGPSDVACIIMPGTYSVELSSNQDVAELVLGTQVSGAGTQSLVEARSVGAVGNVTLAAGSTIIGRSGTFDLGAAGVGNMDVIQGNTLTNGGTINVVRGTGGIRKFDVNVMNNRWARINVSAPGTHQATGTSITNAGAYSIGSGGTLTQFGSAVFTQTATGVLGVTVNANRGLGFGIDAGTVTAGGTLEIRTIGTPAPATSYKVITHAIFSGNFTTVSSAFSYGVRYSSSGVALRSP
jgi:hypothetical protein